MSLPGTLAQGNTEIDLLLIENMLKVSVFQKHHVNNQNFLKMLFHYMATGQEILVFLYNQVPLPAGSSTMVIKGM